ncbi:MAG: DUF393 domain-containing protein [Neomegalonema sp.]|nr:DUF393 domain-containing protein [Neomegalonema sp.]
MIKVYYDGKCGLCSREIAYYKRIAPSGRFDWRDASRDRSVLAERGVSQADALRWMHAEDDAGALHVGVDAFIVIWRGLPWWRRLAPIIAAPVVRPAASWVYRRFAAWRFSRLTHCQLAAADEKGA